MDATPTLESRARALESSLRRTRLGALLLGLTLVALAGSALVPEADQVTDSPSTTRALLSEVSAARAVDQVSASRLVLTDFAGAPAVVIVAGPQSSLVIQTPTGEEVLRLGGPAGRHVVH